MVSHSVSVRDDYFFGCFRKSSLLFCRLLIVPSASLPHAITFSRYCVPSGSFACFIALNRTGLFPCYLASYSRLPLLLFRKRSSYGKVFLFVFLLLFVFHSLYHICLLPYSSRNLLRLCSCAVFLANLFTRAIFLVRNQTTACTTKTKNQQMHDKAIKPPKNGLGRLVSLISSGYCVKQTARNVFKWKNRSCLMCNVESVNVFLSR